MILNISSSSRGRGIVKNPEKSLKQRENGNGCEFKTVDFFVEMFKPFLLLTAFYIHQRGKFENWLKMSVVKQFIPRTWKMLNVKNSPLWKTVSVSVYVADDVFDKLAVGGVNLHLAFHFLNGIDNGGVVAVAEFLTDG